MDTANTGEAHDRELPHVIASMLSTTSSGAFIDGERDGVRESAGDVGYGSIVHIDGRHCRVARS